MPELVVVVPVRYLRRSSSDAMGLECEAVTTLQMTVETENREHGVVLGEVFAGSWVAIGWIGEEVSNGTCLGRRKHAKARDKTALFKIQVREKKYRVVR